MEALFDNIDIAMNHNIIFEDIFEIRVLNENGKKFERGFVFIIIIIIIITIIIIIK